MRCNTALLCRRITHKTEGRRKETRRYTFKSANNEAACFGPAAGCSGVVYRFCGSGTALFYGCSVVSAYCSWSLPFHLKLRIGVPIVHSIVEAARRCHCIIDELELASIACSTVSCRQQRKKEEEHLSEFNDEYESYVSYEARLVVESTLVIGSTYAAN